MTSWKCGLQRLTPANALHISGDDGVTSTTSSSRMTGQAARKNTTEFDAAVLTYGAFGLWRTCGASFVGTSRPLHSKALLASPYQRQPQNIAVIAEEHQAVVQIFAAYLEVQIISDTVSGIAAPNRNMTRPNRRKPKKTRRDGF
jgi:hypothetical protein